MAKRGLPRISPNVAAGMRRHQKEEDRKALIQKLREQFPPGEPPGTPWLDLGPYWKEAGDWALKVWDMKRQYRSHRAYHAESERLGRLGEIVFALETGSTLNSDILKGGDPGYDFIWKGVPINVHANQYWTWPFLVRNVIEKHWSPRYALVIVDLCGKRGALIGFALREELEKARIVDWNQGDCRSLHWSELIRWRTIEAGPDG